MPITESLITLNFPDNNYFRFQDCQGYKDIQNHFKEMDACWYDVNNDTLYLIELKDWSVANLTNREYSDKRIWDLVKKSVDSVSMIMSILLQKPYSASIQACIPFSISGETKIKLLSIVNCNDADKVFISTVNTDYKSRFNAYAKLFNVNTFVVLTKDRATQLFDWIS
ncbi:MAG: hypothetical protein U5N85_23185 [Arcicella sp.]|nr:hypothetical protein [Arcicella sp.]